MYPQRTKTPPFDEFRENRKRAELMSAQTLCLASYPLSTSISPPLFLSLLSSPHAPSTKFCLHDSELRYAFDTWETLKIHNVKVICGSCASWVLLWLGRIRPNLFSIPSKYVQIYFQGLKKVEPLFSMFSLSGLEQELTQGDTRRQQRRACQTCGHIEPARD